MLSTLVLLLHIYTEMRMTASPRSIPLSFTSAIMCNVSEHMCYRAGESEGSIMPVATKPHVKPLLVHPPFILLQPAGGEGKTGGLRSRKTSIRTQRQTGGTPPPIPSSPPNLGSQHTGPPAVLFVSLLSSNMRAQHAHVSNERVPEKFI